MSDSFYKTLNVDIYPLKAEVSTYPTNANTNLVYTSSDLIQYGIDELSPALLDFFQSRQVKLKNTFLLRHGESRHGESTPKIVGWKDEYKTDGNYDSPPNNDCVMIWNAIPQNKSKFMFASMENSTHSYNKVDNSTVWEGTPMPDDMELTSRPILVNTQIPHYMDFQRILPTTTICYLKLYFNESWSSVVAKLSDSIFVPLPEIIEGYVPPYQPI